MIKSEELTNPASCLNKARDDEWLFVLLDRDPAAPAAIWTWVHERIRLKLNRHDDPKIVEALACANRIAKAHAPPPTPTCKCERCGTQLTTASCGNYKSDGKGGWAGVCYACLRPEED